jgi:hypothetical protein
MPRLELALVQLPVPRATALAPTGNVAMAAADLVVAVHTHGLRPAVAATVLPAAVTDTCGDVLLADRVAASEPDLLGLSLYLWNVERSLHLAREVKKRSPRTRIVVGGPEVSADNPLVMAARGIDWAITGEAEATFPAFLAALVEGREPGRLPGVATAGTAGLGAFVPAAPSSFALASYSSPYIAGVLPVDPRCSTYVESMRGCASHCSFCFYPRASPAVRTLPAADTVALLRQLKDQGAKDVAFLDPTFNRRPDFEALLDGLVELNHDRQLTFFAEMRAEGVNAAHVRSLAAAGFARIELGLQSVSRLTRKTVRCGGTPARVTKVARMLQDAGVTAVVDVIVGLPGDTAVDVLAGVELLKRYGLGLSAQVFLLSVLPGTPLRAQAPALGLEFLASPPYQVTRTATLSESALREVWLAAEAALGRSLDESLRPMLVDEAASDTAPDVLHVDLDRVAQVEGAATRPAAAHLALWVEARDLWASRGRLVELLDARLRLEPYAVVDLILRPTTPFPLDLLDALDRVRARWCANGYAARRQGPGGQNGQFRVAVSVARAHGFGPDYLEALAERVPVYEDQTVNEAAAHAASLGEGRPVARVIGDVGSSDAGAWKQLAAAAPPEAVAFAERAPELRWMREVLGHEEHERRR